MTGMELFIVLLLGIVLGWLGAWYVQRQPEMKERARAQQLESELNACRQQLAQSQPARTGAVTLTPEAAAAATPTVPAEFGAPAARYTPSATPAAATATAIPAAAAVQTPPPAPAPSAGVATAASELATYRAGIAPMVDVAAASAEPVAEPVVEAIVEPVMVEPVAEPVVEAATDAIVEPDAEEKVDVVAAAPAPATPAIEAAPPVEAVAAAETTTAEAAPERTRKKAAASAATPEAETAATETPAVETPVVEPATETPAEPNAAEAAPATRAASLTLPAGAADDLTRIKGIGKKFAATLAAQGIHGFAELAASNPEQLNAIIQPQPWQKVDYAPWIQQAQILAHRPRRARVGDDLTRLEGIGPAYAERLRGGNIITYADLATTDEPRLAELIGAKPWQRVRYADWIAQAKLAAAGDEAGLTALQAELNRREADNLTLIRGLGEQSAAALQAAGISTYAALAAATPERVNQALTAGGVRRGNATAWIEEAQQRAAGQRVSRGAITRSRPANGVLFAYPQDLAEVHGIGQVYEQRLYNAGIGSFWELGMIPAPELAAILEVRDFQDVDLAAIQAEALALAASTNTLGRIWDGSEPDDLEAIEGIGSVFEQRLYAAGIGTYADLAATSVERLAELCPPRVGRINYAAWIEQARVKAGG